MVTGPAVAAQRGPLIGGEQHPQPRALGAPRHELVEVGHQQAPRRVGLPRSPFAAQLDQQPLPVHAGHRIVGHLNAAQLLPGTQVELAAVELGYPPDEVALETLGVVVVGVDADVIGLTLVHRLGLGQRRAAPP